MGDRTVKMTVLKLNIRDIESEFGFKNKIKWDATFKIIGYHALGVWWCWHYAFPVKFMTIVFVIFMFFFTGMGITCGVHRLFTHNSYKAVSGLKIFLLICWTATGQNSVYQWVRDHRLHHKFSDTEADPHNANRGLFFSHIGWLMTHKNEEVLKQGKKIDMSDIVNDKHIMFFHRHSVTLNLFFCFILPTVIGIVLWGENWKSAVAWQCFIRFLYTFHIELTVNSLAHIYGYTPYNKNILPKENHLVGVTTFGEGWHNFHHVFPFDYKAAEFCDSFNLSGLLIKWWEKKGWAYDLKEATPEMVKSVIGRLGDENLKLKK